MKRREFLISSVLAAAGSAAVRAHPFVAPPVEADPAKILDLPEGFSYRVISTAGEPMSDGLLTPGRPDGMAAFTAPDGRIALVRNHENIASQNALGAFGEKLELLDKLDGKYFYDYGNGKMPGMGGTTTLLYNPETGEVEKSYLSLAGTELNCAGGPTPWGTWLSCEECFDEYILNATKMIPREQQHGYVFEVDPLAGAIQKPQRLPALGKFVHEAAAVDPETGIIYLTEDRRDGLFYRFIPKQPGKLARGGQLQALAFANPERTDTANLGDQRPLFTGHWHDVHWIDLKDTDTEADDLRLRGRKAGAARFVRGEGIWYHNGEVCFTCTEGGPDKLGQVFRYRSTAVAHDPSTVNTGEMMLLLQSEKDSPLQMADNLTFTPWGDLIVCEDRPENCGLYVVRLDGTYYHLAQHRGSKSELAGVCFSPDGETLFVNIQERGLTLAINGPFGQLSGLDHSEPMSTPGLESNSESTEET